MKLLSDAINELKQIIQDLRDDQSKLLSMPLKKVPELIQETIRNFAEDVEDMNAQYEELKALPENPVPTA